MPTMLEPGILIDERYRLDALIGEGAMGQVWRAADIQLENEPVAIKFLTAQIAEDEVWRSEFHREMQTLVKLGGHAYLVQVFAYGRTEGIGPYMVMEYLSRGSLKTRLSEVQSNPTLLRQILSELCDALDHLHQDCGIVHLDLKPSNILFDAGNHIRLADFGIARALDTILGEVMPLGTPGYRAPEQEQGCAAVDHRADLYALGMVARELLEQSLTPQIEKLLDKANAPDPAARYTTANELWRVLQPLLPRHYAGGYLLPDQKYDFLVKQLPYSLQERVSRTLDDYTRVFGGRQAEMEALDQWLDQADQPFGIVQAPTGRGKTALLIQLALNAQGNGWHVIFFPISQRYETADQGVVVRGLTYALATLFQVDTPGPDTAPDWLLAQIADWLRRGLPENTRLLVVVDGLDEAIGDYVGALFPNQVAPDVKVLVAARTLANEGIGAWAARLKWTLGGTQLFDVGMLARRDLRDIVNRYADEKLQALAADDSFIAELWRVSEGDPLTVRMLMDDLAAGYLTSQDLSRRPVGLQAYLQAWLEGLEQQVESEAAWQLLGLCATAYGPLTTDDLVELDPVTFKVARHVRQAVRPVARVLLGDGEEEHGYVFNHSRLREFFYERLSEREHTAYQKAFVDYGQRCYTQLPEKPCPSYVRRFWVTHLAKTGEWDLLHQVVATGEEQQVWAEMRYAAEANYVGYLTDVDLGWKHVFEIIQNDLKTLGWYIRYSLIKGSIHSITSWTPSSLLAASAKYGLWNIATILEYVDYKKTGHGYGYEDAIVSLAPYFLKEMWDEILEQEFKANRSNVFINLLPYMPAEFCPKVIRIIRGIEDEATKIWSLVRVLDHLPEMEKVRIRQEILTMINLQKDPLFKAQVLTSIAPSLLADVEKELLHEVSNLTPPSFPNWTEPEIGVLSEAAWYERHMLADAAWNEVSILSELTRYVPELGLQAIWNIAQKIDNQNAQAGIMCEMISRLISLGHFDRALTMFQILKTMKVEEHYYIQAAAELFPYLPQHLQEEILLTIQGFTGQSYKEALIQLVPKLSGDLILRTWHTVYAIEDRELRLEILVSLIPYIAKDKHEEIPNILAEVKKIENGMSKTKLLVDIVDYLPEDERLETLRQAWMARRKLEDIGNEAVGYIWGMVGFAFFLPELLIQKALTALEMAKIATSDDINVLTSLITQLNRLGEKQLVSNNLQILCNNRIEIVAELNHHILHAKDSVDLMLGTVELLFPELQTLVAESNTNPLPNSINEKIPFGFNWSMGETPFEFGWILIELPRDQLQSIFIDTIRNLIQFGQGSLIYDLGILAPVIYQLGGEEAIVEVFHAIQNVRTWWP